MTPARRGLLRRLLLSGLRIALAVYLLACLGLYLAQDGLLYHPTAALPDPQSRLQLDSGGVRLNVSAREASGAAAIVYFGGNAEDVAQTLPDYAAAFPDRAIYMLHYRGYGGSAGAPREADLHADALALYRHVRARHPQVSVIGRSLGSGIAVRLAASAAVDKLVLITPYDSIERVAQARYPLFPVSLLLRDKYESWRYAPRITAPTRIVIAGRDQLVPPEHAETLAQAFAPGVAHILRYPAADHHTVLDEPGFYARLLD